jgi:hypothetical protein
MRSRQNHPAFMGKKQQHERYCCPDPSPTRVRSPVLLFEDRQLINNSDCLSAEATPSMLASHGTNNFCPDPEGTGMLTGELLVSEAVARTESELDMVQANTSPLVEADIHIEYDRYAHFEQHNHDKQQDEASSPPKESSSLPSAVSFRPVRNS